MVNIFREIATQVHTVLAQLSAKLVTGDDQIVSLGLSYVRVEGSM